MITDTGKTPNSPMLTKSNKVSNIYGLGVFVLLLLLFVPFTLSFTDVASNELDTNIKEYFIPSYDNEFLTITDIQSLGFILYLGYPIIIVLIGVLLWCVLIGILRISGL
jgi:di/tricarboxylate transporter